MLINYNGQLIDHTQNIFNINSSIISSSDAVTISLRIVNNSIHLWEENYFNLMAAARIMRMKIPLHFTPEFFQEQINLLLSEFEVKNGKLNFVCYRSLGIDDLQESIEYYIQYASSTHSWEYFDEAAEIDVYKDFVVNDSFFSQNNILRPEENIAKIYAQENEFADLVLINQHKRMAKSLFGAIFLIQDDSIKTPKMSEGVTKSVLRDHFIKNIQKSEHYKIEETDIFPFEMQKAEEIFVLMDGIGIRSFTQNRKKIFKTLKTENLLQFLD